MAHQLGGRVAKAPHREFGHADVSKVAGGGGEGVADLLAGLPEKFTVWMSHGDKIHEVPPGFERVGTTADCEFAAAASVGRVNRLFGLQFHPEVAHTPQGKDILGNFVVRICGAKQDWSMASFMEGEFGIPSLRACMYTTHTQPLPIIQQPPLPASFSKNLNPPQRP